MLDLRRFGFFIRPVVKVSRRLSHDEIKLGVYNVLFAEFIIAITLITMKNRRRLSATAVQYSGPGFVIIL